MHVILEGNSALNIYLTDHTMTFLQEVPQVGPEVLLLPAAAICTCICKHPQNYVSNCKTDNMAYKIIVIRHLFF